MEPETKVNPIRWYHPLPLTALVVVVSVLAMFIIQAINGNGTIPWRAAAVGILFYSITNQVSALVTKRWVRYTLISYGCFVAMMILLLWVAGQIAHTPLSQLFYMRRIYVLLIVFYVLQTILVVIFRVLHMMLRGDEIF